MGRVLGAAASPEPGFVTVRQTGAPIVITLPGEAAMALLNDLQEPAAIGGWFDITKPY